MKAGYFVLAFVAIDVSPKIPLIKKKEQPLENKQLINYYLDNQHVDAIY